MATNKVTGKIYFVTKLDNDRFCDGCPFMMSVGGPHEGSFQCVLEYWDEDNQERNKKNTVRPKKCIDNHGLPLMENITTSYNKEIKEYLAIYNGLEMVSAVGKTEDEARRNLGLWIKAILTAYNDKHGYLGNLPGDYYEELRKKEYE